MAGGEPPHRAHDEREALIGPPHRGTRDDRERLPESIRDPSFPTAVHGYSRRAVDTYVEQVNTLIAELQVSISPRAAVRQALDRIGEQTSGILQHARETAEEITASAREEADATTERAKAEAHDIATDAHRRADDIVSQARIEAEARIREVEHEIAARRSDAEARLRSLQADMAAISDERHTLLDEIRQISARLDAVAAEAEPTEDETPPDAVSGAASAQPMSSAEPDDAETRREPAPASNAGRQP